MSFNAYVIHVKEECSLYCFLVVFIKLPSFCFLAKGTLSEDTIASFLRQIGKIVIPDIK